MADNSNQRTDEYGGSLTNKSRFIVETMQALIDAVGADKVGIKLSPLQPYAGVLFNAPLASFQQLFNALNKLDFAFVELMQRSPMFSAPAHYPQQNEIALFGKMNNKVLIANGGYDQATMFGGGENDDCRGDVPHWLHSDGRLPASQAERIACRKRLG